MDRRYCSRLVGAGFALLFACSDDTAGKTSQNPPDSEDTGSNNSESNNSETMSSASSGTPGSNTSGTKSKPKSGDAMTTAPSDQTEFFSANPRAAGNAPNSGEIFTPNSGGRPATGDSGSSESEGRADGSQNAVVRGDIFRVLSDKRILNLNTYRGLQVLDVTDLSKPRLEGQLPVAGNPVELYVLGDRAFVLLNEWTGYFGARDSLEVRAASGGLVMSVDIKDRAHPKLIDQAEIKGEILTSRLTQGSDGQAALYVAATFYDSQMHTSVKSFEVSSGELMAKTELDLGGQVRDIQATTDLMMVAINDNTKLVQRSIVTVIDISRTDGTMVKGGSVTPQGFVADKFNMDAYKGVLRVVSGADFNPAHENRLETFSLSNLQDLEPIDSCKLTPRDPTRTDEQLFATVFVENRAFFVTYYRKDPFHAFSIDDSGKCQEHTQFIVSGWNNFLRPVLDNTRLIGVGHNDVNNSSLLSISLYDAVNLDNSTPLLARADIELNFARSDANAEDRALSVLENAVSVRAEDGTEETGLVLLPFSGWDMTTQSRIARVQLFTFSNRTLTKRGSMDHGTIVHRSFGVASAATGNLSDESFSVFDTKNPDQPAEISRLELASSHSRVFVYGDYVARLRDNSSFAYIPGEKLPQSNMQIVSAAGDVESNPALAAFDVPALGTLTQVGDLLVSVFSDTTFDQDGLNPKSKSQIQVWDLKDPTKPQARGALETDQLETVGWYPNNPSLGCIDCGRPIPGLVSESYVVGSAIVYANTKSQQESLGLVTQCDTYPVDRACSGDGQGGWSCENPYYSGGVTCITSEGGDEDCSGHFYMCDDRTGECSKSDPPMLTNRTCNHFEKLRYWQSYSFDSVDLRNPDKPTLGKRVALPADEEVTSVIALGDTMYSNFHEPYDKPDDDRSYVKHYARKLGFSDPQNVSVGEPINIPGDVIAVRDTTWYTRDLVWTDTDARTTVARVSVEGDKAHLQASEVFDDRQVSKVKFDDAGHIFVSSDPIYDRVHLNPPTSKLSILNDQDLKVLGEAEIALWGMFTEAKRGLALYRVAGGLLVIDIKDATKPKAQAYFPVQDWPEDIVFDGESILLAGGWYGVHRLDASVFNLLMP